MNNVEHAAKPKTSKWIIALAAFGLAGFLAFAALALSQVLATKRILEGSPGPQDFVKFCDGAVVDRQHTLRGWRTAQLSNEPPRISVAAHPQTIVCSAKMGDGSTVSFEIRVICADSANPYCYYGL